MREAIPCQRLGGGRAEQLVVDIRPQLRVAADQRHQPLQHRDLAAAAKAQQAARQQPGLAGQPRRDLGRRHLQQQRDQVIVAMEPCAAAAALAERVEQPLDPLVQPVVQRECQDAGVQRIERKPRGDRCDPAIGRRVRAR